MKRLILIQALFLALAACAGEPQVVVVTATPTVTPAPPSATPIPPTITPEAWDATVSALSTGLRQLPDNLSQVIATLPGGTTVDLLAIAEDQEWVQVTAYLEGDSAIEGWLQVDKLKLNVSLDDLEVDTEIAKLLPPTRTPGPTPTPGPTEAPLGERFVAHFLERGFEYYDEQDQYMLIAGRGVLIIKVTDDAQILGYVMYEPMTDEEVVIVREHLIEGGEFLDPGHGWETIQSAYETIALNITDNGTSWARGREVQWRTIWLTADTRMVVFTFPNIPTYVGTPIDG